MNPIEEQQLWEDVARGGIPPEDMVITKWDVKKRAGTLRRKDYMLWFMQKDNLGWWLRLSPIERKVYEEMREEIARRKFFFKVYGPEVAYQMGRMSEEQQAAVKFYDPFFDWVNEKLFKRPRDPYQPFADHRAFIRSLNNDFLSLCEDAHIEVVHFFQRLYRSLGYGGSVALAAALLAVGKYLYEEMQSEAERSKYKTNLTGKVAVVTGAHHGIGKQIALEFSSMGATVIRVVPPRPALYNQTKGFVFAKLASLNNSYDALVGQLASYTNACINTTDKFANKYVKPVTNAFSAFANALSDAFVAIANSPLFNNFLARLLFGNRLSRRIGRAIAGVARFTKRSVISIKPNMVAGARAFVSWLDLKQYPIVTVPKDFIARRITLEVDWDDPESIRELAQKIKDLGLNIDYLINAESFTNTTDRFIGTNAGIEKQFAYGYLGHFLLTNLLLDEIIASKTRVIHFSSDDHKRAKLGVQLDTVTNPSGYNWEYSYTQTKLANIMFNLQLQKMLDGTGASTVVIYPGKAYNADHTRMYSLPSRLISAPFWFYTLKKTEALAHPVMSCALNPKVENGSYYKGYEYSDDISEIAFDETKREELWDKTVEMLGGL